MTALFDRRFEILIDDEILVPEMAGRQFKFTFEVLHDFGAFVSYCDMTLTNLLHETVSKSFVRGKKLTIRAGYVNNIDTIFSGMIQNTIRPAGGVDSIARIIARGGNSESQNVIINQTLGAPANVIDIITACSDALGYDTLITPVDFANEPPYARGYSMSGDPRSYLDKLANTHGFRYLIENGTLVIVKNGSTILGRTYLISQFTGMEGAPEITEVGADVVTRLWPQMRVGGKFTIDSTFKDFNFNNVYFQNIPESAGTGTYDILRLMHSGDSMGDAWSTRITGTRGLN